MKHKNILNLLNDANDSKFVTGKWNTVNDNSKADYDGGNEIPHNTEALKSNLWDYNDAYTLVRGDITVRAAPEIQVALKNCAPFTTCITKIDITTIDDAENLDSIMPMYNLIEYSWNYFETAGSLWFNSEDEVTDVNADVANTNDFKSFKYKTKFLGNTVAHLASNATNGILKNATIAVPLKYLSNHSSRVIYLRDQSKYRWLIAK